MKKCPHCGIMYLPNHLARHVKHCPKSPSILKKLTAWANAHTEEVNGEQRFPTIATYVKTKDESMPGHSSVVKTFGGWPGFREAVAPHIAPRERGRRVAKREKPSEEVIETTKAELLALRNDDGIVISYTVNRDTITHYTWLATYGRRKFCHEHGISYRTKGQKKKPNSVLLSAFELGERRDSIRLGDTSVLDASSAKERIAYSRSGRFIREEVWYLLR